MKKRKEKTNFDGYNEDDTTILFLRRQSGEKINFGGGVEIARKFDY